MEQIKEKLNKCLEKIKALKKINEYCKLVVTNESYL
jgi:hypothetical protein